MASGGAVLHWPPLVKGTLVKRYQRFKADVMLKDGRVVTAHCPNSGSMRECSTPGRPVFLSQHTNPARKLKYTWELIEMPSSLVGVNTIVPNKLARLAAENGRIPELGVYESVRAEVRYGQNSRIDLLLEKKEGKCFVEVKNCTLVKDRVAYFPDAVTSRGLKHLLELQEAVRAGHKAVMFFLVQRMDAQRFKPADHIDPAYGSELRNAAKNGVEVLAYDVRIDLQSIRLNTPLPMEM